jgi:LemA protein
MDATVLVVIGVLVAAGALWLWSAYNRLVKCNNHCVEAWSNVDTELKRRYALVPNLVRTVKGYAGHERDLLHEVTRLRNVCADNTGPPAAQADTEKQLVQALQRLLVRVEAYPDLKASQNFLELQEELTNTEDRIQAARRFFNGNVRKYNNALQVFPNNIVAGAFGFKERAFFEVEPAVDRDAPEVPLRHGET